jgi:hypothetical protein
MGLFSAVCPECLRPFGFEVFNLQVCSVFGLVQSKDDAATDANLRGASTRTYPPDPSAIVADVSVPEKIREQFVFIQEDARRRRNAPGILGGARTCLDVALKELGESSGGRRDRISNLAKRGIVTNGIAAWAQDLWEEGSDAIHDLDATLERAIEHVEFLKLFFEVAFALPARIASAHPVTP